MAADTYSKCPKSSPNGAHAGRGELRMVHVVGHICRESPVVCAVLEEIPQRHGGVREAVHENRLQQTLHIVDRIAAGGNAGAKEKRKRVTG